MEFTDFRHIRLKVYSVFYFFDAIDLSAHDDFTTKLNLFTLFRKNSNIRISSNVQEYSMKTHEKIIYNRGNFFPVSKNVICFDEIFYPVVSI